MPVLDSYLFFTGRCAEAMRFYERTLGGKLEAVMKYSDAPDPQGCPAGADDLVMHASLLVDGRRLMASDCPPGHPGGAMGGFSLSLNYPTAQEAAASSTRFRRAARSRCRCRRPSGPRRSAC